jgi:hypothetical protein
VRHSRVNYSMMWADRIPILKTFRTRAITLIQSVACDRERMIFDEIMPKCGEHAARGKSLLEDVRAAHHPIR